MRLAYAVVALPLLIASYSVARANACSELRFTPNQDFKTADCCFKMDHAFAAFSNADYQYEEIQDIVLLKRGRTAIVRYVREEAAIRCWP